MSAPHLMSGVLLIAGMAAITLVIRALIFVCGERIVFPPLLKTALEFVPVAVLSAIVAPMVLAPHGGALELSLHNTQLLAACVTVLVSLLTRSHLLSIAVGIATFFALQFATGVL